MCKNQSNNGFDCQCANIGSCTCDPIGSGKAKPHKWADVIKAWADGATIEYFQPHEEKWIDWRKGFTQGPTPHLPFCDEKSPYKFRVKPEYPTLSEIAQQAFYDRLTNDPYQPGPGSRERWQNVAKAMKKAIESGEYSQA